MGETSPRSASPIRVTNAPPLDFLQRLIWQNDIFGDDIHLVGIWQAQPYRWRILDAKPDNFILTHSGIPRLERERITFKQISYAIRTKC